MRGSVKLPPLGTRLVPPPGGVGVSSDFELLGANLRNGKLHIWLHYRCFRYLMYLKIIDNSWFYLYHLQVSI